MFLAGFLLIRTLLLTTFFKVKKRGIKLKSAVIEAGIINTFKSRLQKLRDKDESVFGRYPFS